MTPACAVRYPQSLTGCALQKHAFHIHVASFTATQAVRQVTASSVIELLMYAARAVAGKTLTEHRAHACPGFNCLLVNTAHHAIERR